MLVPWLTARALLVAGYVVAVAAADRLVADDKPRALTEGLIAWDGTWYRDIAAHGYHSLPDEALRFFPLFPLLGKAFSIVTAGRVDVALVIIANVASLALAVAVRRLVRFERGNDALADRAVWMVCLFPGRLRPGVGLRRGAVAARRRRGVLGHPEPALVVGGGRRGGGRGQPAPRHRAGGPRGRRARPGRGARRAPTRGSPGSSPWCRRSSGPGRTWLWVGVVLRQLPAAVLDPGARCGASRSTRSAGSGRGCTRWSGPDRFSDGLHVPFAIAFVVLLVLTFRWWPVSYGLFAALVLAAALGAENLNSLERYGLNAFPLALSLAVLAKDPRVDKVLTTVLGGGVVALSSLAWLGAYVP